VAKPPAAQRNSKELGVASGRGYTGSFNADDFLPQLRGIRATRTFREMRDNDSTIGAVFFAFEMILRAVNWRIEAVDESPEAEQAKEFVEGAFGDMSHTFEDFISEILSFLTFGYSYFEVVSKRRMGPHQTDGSRRSRFDDGLIGFRKIAPRPQWTLDRYKLDDNGGITGFHQQAMGRNTFLPIEKCILFRTTSTNGNPTGRSLLRNAWTSYHYMTNIMQIESIAIERDLNGLPVGFIPGAYLADSATAAQIAVRNALETTLRDVKFNEQGYVMLPSDLWQDDEGKFSSVRQVDMKLMASEGSRDIDTSAVIQRYQGSIARSMLADFVTLGQGDKGSFALSKSKTDLFLEALEGYAMNVASTINRHLIPKLWAYNGFDLDMMPTLVPGRVRPIDLKEFGDFISALSSAGAPLFPDEELENVVREMADLPERVMDDDDLLPVAQKPEPEQTEEPEDESV